MKTSTPPGLILLHKPVGPSSHSALTPIKHGIGSKIGHCGTLDPFAEGLLLVLCGACTKFQPLFLRLEKSYRCTIVFGKHTPSLDNTTEVVQHGKIPKLAEVGAVLPQFIGTIEQVPPQYSAIKVGGVRAYHRARQGVNIQLKARSVFIYSIDVVAYNNGMMECDVVCSSGTYIRSLASDIANACGTVAHLSALCRTSIGQFNLADSVSAQHFDVNKHLVTPDSLPQQMVEIGCITIVKQDEDAIAHGVPIIELQCANAVQTSLQQNKKVVMLLDDQQRLRAACTMDNGTVRYLFVCAKVK